MTVAYFAVQNVGAQVISPADVVVCTGRPTAGISTTSGSDEIGVYLSMGSYVQSVVGYYNTSLYGAQIMLLQDDGGAVKMNAYTTVLLTKGQRYTAISIFREGDSDDGICHQVINGVDTYFTKYSATIV